MENVRNTLVSVGTSAVLLSPRLKQGARRVIVLTNTSTGGQNITLSWGQEAQAGYGMVLTPNSSWSESVDSGFIPSNLEIWAIASAVSGQVSIHERVLE